MRFLTSIQPRPYSVGKIKPDSKPIFLSKGSCISRLIISPRGIRVANTMVRGGFRHVFWQIDRYSVSLTSNLTEIGQD
jgi:hypothetical protein